MRVFKNVTTTTALLALMGAFFIGIGSMFGWEGILCAILAAVITGLWMIFQSTASTLESLHAQEVDYQADPWLIGKVRSLAAKADIPAPRIFEIDTDQANALALGRDPDHAVIVITKGIRATLDRDQLAAILAHEIAHIAARDTMTMAIATGLMAGVVLLGLLLAMVGAMIKHGHEDGGTPLIVLGILFPAIALILRMAVSRGREFEADRIGAGLCGSPGALAAALRKLDTESRKTPNLLALGRPATAALYSVHPFPGHRLARLFASHPPTEKRIKRLMEL